MSVFISFYAYKGGTGRTSSLVHTAWTLAREGRRVILLDLDLAAPSLWPLLGTGEPVDGFIELVADWQQGRAHSVAPYLQEVPLDSKAAGSLHVMSAGRMDGHYLSTLEGLDWQQLTQPRRLPSSVGQQELFGPSTDFFEFLRRQFEEHVLADAVFIDAPTGLSDTANVCLRLLADVVTVIFSPTRVQLQGIGRVVGLLTAEQQSLRLGGSKRPHDVFCVASTLMARRMSGMEIRRIQEAFRFLNLVRFEALGRPPLTEEAVDLVEQPPAIIAYDPAIADLERIDTTSAPAEVQTAVYEDVLRYLRQCVPPRQNRFESRGQLKKERKLELLSNLVPQFEQFGEEETEKLKMYFLRSSHVDRLRDPSVVLVLGGKGSGKTALFLYATGAGIHDRAKDEAIHGPKTPGLSPDRLVEIEHQVPSMDVFWRVYCLAQLDLAQPRSLPSGVSPIVIEAVEATKRLKTGNLDLLGGLGAFRASNLAVEIDLAWSIVDDALGQQGHRRVLYLDGLDTAFKADLEQRRRGLSALFVAWQATFSKLRHIDLKVFLRSDLWEQLSFPEKSHLRTKTMQLSWTQEDLWRLVVKRALCSESFKRLCDTWGIEPKLDTESVEASAPVAIFSYLDVLFEQRIWAGKNSLSRSWIMRRLADARDTIFPRDVLCLLSEAIREEQSRIRDDSRITPDAILSRESLAKALPPTSKQRVDALREEYPELVDVLESLKGLPAKGKTEELRSHFAQRRWSHDIQPLDALEKAGVLSLEEDSYDVPALYLHGLNMTRPGPT